MLAYRASQTVTVGIRGLEQGGQVVLALKIGCDGALGGLWGERASTRGARPA